VIAWNCVLLATTLSLAAAMQAPMATTQAPMATTDPAADPEVLRQLTAVRIRAGSPPDVRQRERALAWLAEHAERAWPTVLARAEASPHDPVLIDVVGRLRRPEATSLLRRAFADEHTRAYAAAGLGLSPDPAARAFLRATLDSPHHAEVVAALTGLGASGDSAVCADVTPRVEADDAEIRWAAVDAAIKAGCLDAAALERLAREDPDPDVRARAGRPAAR
jgi:hypothetical protein